MNLWPILIFYWINSTFGRTIPCTLEFLGGKCEKETDSAFLLFSSKAFHQQLFLLPTDDSEAEMKTIKLGDADKNLEVLTFDAVRNYLYFFVKNKNVGQIRRISRIEMPSELVLEDENLQNIRSMVVDSITGTIFVANGFRKTIEGISLDGKNRLTMTSDGIDPFSMVFHPVSRTLYFSNYKNPGFEIRQVSMSNFKVSTVLVENAGQMTSLAIDYDNDRVFWSTESNFGGTIQSMFVSADDFRQQIIGSDEISPNSMHFSDGMLYFSNKKTKSIDVIDESEIWTKVFKNLPVIEEFVVVRKEKPMMRDPCKNVPEKENAICFLTEKFEIVWNCKDGFTVDENSSKCIRLITKVAVSSTTAKTKFECKESEFECFDGEQCIAFAGRCDGIKDCNDGSDESPRICKFIFPFPINRTETNVKKELQILIFENFHVLFIAAAAVLVSCVILIAVCCRKTKTKYKNVFTDQISPMTNLQTTTTDYLTPPLLACNHPAHNTGHGIIYDLDQCLPPKKDHVPLPLQMPLINSKLFESGLKRQRQPPTRQNQPQISVLSWFSEALECSTPKSDVPPPRTKSGRYNDKSKPIRASFSGSESSSELMAPMNTSLEDS